MRVIVFLLLALSVAGCIKNDVPFPVIYGNVQKIEFEGQQKCVVNTKTRTIELTLADTVDIKRVKITKLEITADPATMHNVSIEPVSTLKQDSVLDLSQTLKFTISTYQDYEWTLVTEQPIDYYLEVEGQDKVVINEQERTALIYMPEGTKLSELKVTRAKLGASVAEYDPNPTTLTNFTRAQTVSVTCFGRTVKWSIFAVYTPEGEGPVTTLTGEANAWAKFAVLNGNIPAGNSGEAAFEYRKSRESSWQRVNAVISGKTFSAKVTGLEAATSYVFRGIVGEEKGEEKEFTTEGTDQVPYMNFDSWYMSGKAVCPGVEGITVWDTGNKGGASFGFNPTTEEKTDVKSGSAARLTSVYAAVKFAAGSIYTGTFGGLDGLNAKLNFGIPYTCRPTTLTGYYKYTPGVIDRVKEPYEYLSGQTDSCHIYVALCDWTEPFQANSKTLTFVDYSERNSTILAYGELKTSQKVEQYQKFTIDIKYRDTERKPKYIVIVATSSKYGDYFSGSTSSVLLIDEFELGFD